jgi:hypothetical protein
MDSLRSDKGKDRGSLTKAIEAYRSIYTMEVNEAQFVGSERVCPRSHAHSLACTHTLTHTHTPTHTLQSKVELYGAVNLLTLLYCQSLMEPSKRAVITEECQKIISLVDEVYEEKGALDKLVDYWEIATYFEVKVVESYLAPQMAEDVLKSAIQAAEAIHLVEKEPWMIATTMHNMKLLIDQKNESDALGSVSDCERGSERESCVLSRNCSHTQTHTRTHTHTHTHRARKM